MYYSISVKHVILDKKGNDKETITKFLTDVELFADAEYKGLQQFPKGCDVTSISRTPIKEFANERTNQEGEAIYIAKITSTFLSDNGEEKKTKNVVALYALSTTNADKIVSEYMAQGLDDMECEKIEKTSFVDVI